MPKPRARTVPPTAEEIEEFGNQAEQPRPASSVPTAAAAQAPRTRRAKEPKSAGYTFRMTAAQKQLLTLAAVIEDTSEQKILERLVWPVLMERYSGPGDAQSTL